MNHVRSSQPTARFRLRGNHRENAVDIAYDALREITFGQFVSVREYLSVTECAFMFPKLDNKLGAENAVANRMRFTSGSTFSWSALRHCEWR
jgi:hypothetical protein